MNTIDTQSHAELAAQMVATISDVAQVHALLAIEHQLARIADALERTHT